MRVVPRNTVPQIEYFKSHLAVWLEQAEEIGTSPEQVALLQETVQAAVEAMQQRNAAHQAARAATLRLKTAQKKMFTVGRGIIQQVHAKATVQGSDIYTLARISAPSEGAPLEAPGTPERITHSMDVNGAITLKWKCKNPVGSTGTTYHVSRSIDGSPVAWIGMTGDKKFIDETVPQGSRQVTYRLQAVRSTGVGKTASYLVPLGSDGFRPQQMMQIKQRHATLYAA